jgi:hypothetical protein
MVDPTRECSPDYTLPEFDNERFSFTMDGKTNEEAVEVLRAPWMIQHVRDIGNWECQQAISEEEERQRREQAELDAEQQCTLHLEEEEEAKKEEKKKCKNKFTPIPDRLLPATALLLPLQYALTKLHKGDYIPLYLCQTKVFKKQKRTAQEMKTFSLKSKQTKDPPSRRAPPSKQKAQDQKRVPVMGGLQESELQDDKHHETAGLAQGTPRHGEAFLADHRKP